MNRAGWTLAGLALVVAGLTGMARAPRDADAIARLGPITVSATALSPGPSGTLTASLQVSTAGPRPDQLDAAIAADGAPVGAQPHGLCVWPQPGRYSLGHTGVTR